MADLLRLNTVPIGTGLTLILGPNRSRFPYGNCLLVKGDLTVLVDTGAGPGLKSILPRVDLIAHSHFHVDHVSGDGMYDAPVRIHRSDAPALASAGEYLRFTGLGEVLAGSAESPASREEILGKQFLHDGVAPERVLPFSDGEVLDCGSVKLRAVHAPGHSPGHTVFVVDRLGFAFLGDIDLGPFGPWYGHPVCDIEAYEASIKMIKDMGPVFVATGHRGVIIGRSVVASALESFLGVFRQRDRKILSLLSQPRTLEQLVDRWPIYGRPLKPISVYRHFERQMVKKHVERLMSRGLVQATEVGGEAVYVACTGARRADNP